MDGRAATRYDDDFYAWTQEQAAALRQAAHAPVNVPIDWAHLAEEVEDLGNSQRFAVESHMERVIEHLLKLQHSPASDPRADWEASVDTHRTEAARRLTPSIRRHVEATLAERYRIGRRHALRGLARDGVTTLPEECPYSLDQVLDPDWWPTI